ncbi:hypothetical protein JCM10207_005728 [Rhodosporidiobolus poonsookiae]
MASAAPVTAQLPTSDRLSTLPVEILTEIFQLAYTGTSPSEGPISRALLPFDRAQRFRRLEVDSSEKLKSLAGVLETGSVGAWVKEVKMKQVEAADGTLQLKDRQLRAFFASLPRLTHLKLNDGCDALLSLILSQNLARNSLRRLTCLTFVAPTKWKNPFEPKQLVLLRSYPALHALTVQSTKEWYKLFRTKPLTGKVKPIPGITSLTVEAEGADLPALTRRLLSAFPSLRSMDIFASSQRPDLSPVLPLLPTSLTSLTLRTRAFYDYSAPCDALFARFGNLEYLYLGEGTFGPTILDALRPLNKLKTLGFGRGAILPVRDLSMLLDPASPLPHLQKLILDVVFGKRGYRTMADGRGKLHPEAKLPFYTAPDWVVPRFSRVPGPFHDSAVERFVEEAKTSGVEIVGSTVEALKIMADWYCEITEATMAHGVETGDFSEARELMGDDFVDELLMDMGWGEDYWGDYDDYDGLYGCG